LVRGRGRLGDVLEEGSDRGPGVLEEFTISFSHDGLEVVLGGF
jgi:hypothetical protein